jgi:hypothetical protein
MNFKSLKYGLMHGLVIMNFAGNPYVQLKEEKAKPKLKDNLSLKSDTYIRTNPNDYVVLKINDRYQVTILPDSIFTVDGVRHKDEFNIRSLYIRRGKIHVKELQDPVDAAIQKIEKQTKSKVKIVGIKKGSKPNTKIHVIDITSLDRTSADKSLAQMTSFDDTEIDAFEPLKIESDFFSILTQKDQKLSLLIDVNLKEAKLNVCNFGSTFKLELFDHEIDQTLKANEGIKFSGALDKADQIAYDLLLEKRKIPKGKWGAKEVCLADQIKKIQDQVVEFHLKTMQDLEKARLAQIAEKKRKDLLYLCHEPYGKLDQCHFILRQNKCIRERCNAEGKWTDQTEIGVVKNLCSVKGEVKGCGY